MQKGAPKREDGCSCCSQGMGGIEAAPAASSCLPSSTCSPHAPFDPLVEAAVAALSSAGFCTHRRVSKMMVTSVFLSAFSHHYFLLMYGSPYCVYTCNRCHKTGISTAPNAQYHSASTVCAGIYSALHGSLPEFTAFYLLT